MASNLRSKHLRWTSCFETTERLFGSWGDVTRVQSRRERIRIACLRQLWGGYLDWWKDPTFMFKEPHPHFHYEMGGLKAHIKWLAGVIL